MKSKAFCLGVIVLVATLLPHAAFAACGTPEPVQNSSTGFQSGLSAGLGTNVLVRFWERGNVVGANSGTLAQTNIATPCGGCGANTYYLFSGWGQTGVVGCPNPAGRTVALYSDVNLTGATTVPRFVVMSVRRTGEWDFDDMTNCSGPAPNNKCASRPHPALNVDAIVPLAGPSFDVTVNWPAMTNLRGAFDIDPGTNIITGVAVYFRNFAAGQVADTLGEFQRTAPWALAAGGPNGRAGFVSFPAAGVDPGNQIVNIPRPAPGTNTFLAVAILFDGATPADPVAQTSWVGPASSGITESGILYSSVVARGVTGGQVKVDWTTNVETNVTGYEVFWAKKANETFVSGSPVIPATGDGSSYTHTFKPAAKVGIVYVKVKAHLNGGGEIWSQVVTATMTALSANP